MSIVHLGERKPHKCPVCGKTEFPCTDSYDVCSECDWTDNRVQEEYPDEDGLENLYSLNFARKQYQKYGTTVPFYLWGKRMEREPGWGERLKNLDSLPEEWRKVYYK